MRTRFYATCQLDHDLIGVEWQDQIVATIALEVLGPRPRKAYVPRLVDDRDAGPGFKTATGAVLWAMNEHRERFRNQAA